MPSRPAKPTATPTRTSPLPTQPGAAAEAPGTAIDQPSALIRSAMRFAARSHATQRRDSDHGPFIKHPVEVAQLLRDAGCPDIVIAAGLLHDVLETTQTSLPELRARFGTEVADLVQTVSEDASIRSYRQRKHVLREQVRDTGGPAALIFAADKIAKVRELPDRVARERARYGTAMPERLQHDHQLRLEHYTQSLRMLQRIAPTHPLIRRLASELRNCPVTADNALRRHPRQPHSAPSPRA